MASATMNGRLGNLTAEQVQKLKEFWRVTLRVFGDKQVGDNASLHKSTLSSDAASIITASTYDAPNSPSRTSTTSQRKSRFFGRKSTSAAESGPQSSQEVDKYGQTKEFNEALAKNPPDAMRQAYWRMIKAEDPDAVLLRFLRARKWDVNRALVMMISTLHWRLNAMHMDDDLMFNGEMAMVQDSQSADAARAKEGGDFLAQMRMGKAFLHGTDREGRPICTITVRLHKIGAQSDTSLERLTVFTFEVARLLLTPPVDTATLIFDMTGFSLINMDYTPLKFIIKCFEANYPESLGTVLVHKAPWLFQGFWKVIRGWLDPVVASKIHFTSNLEDLESFIERDHIPRALGGDEDWEFQYIEPVPGENDLMQDATTRDRLLAERVELSHQYDQNTHRWLADTTTEDFTLTTERQLLAEGLKANYWALDPYIRARSVYDRNGLIKPVEDSSLDDQWEDAPEWPIQEIKPDHAAYRDMAVQVSIAA